MRFTLLKTNATMNLSPALVLEQNITKISFSSRNKEIYMI